MNKPKWIRLAVLMLCVAMLLCASPNLTAAATQNIVVNARWAYVPVGETAPDITAWLVINGVKSNQSLTLTSADSTQSFTGLTDGKTYTLEVDGVADYKLTVTGNADDGFSVQADCSKNTNAYALTFVNLGKNSDGNVVYQFLIKQTIADANEEDASMATFQMAFLCDRGEFISGQVVEEIPGYDGVGEVPGNPAAFCIAYTQNALTPIKVSETEFMYLATVITSQDCAFSILDQPGNAITCSGFQNSAYYELVTAPPQLTMTNASGTGTQTQITVKAEAPFNSLVIYAAYDGDNRMLAAQTCNSSAWDWQNNSEPHDITLNLACDYSQVTQVKVFALDSSSSAPLCENDVYPISH